MVKGINMRRDEHSNYSIGGRITDYQSATPLSGLKVRAYDKDFFREQVLGESATDENGNYQIRFSRNDFSGPLIKLERHPDIFIVIYDNGNEIYSTSNSVIVNAEAHTTIDAAIRFLRQNTVSRDIQTVQGTPVDLKYLPKLTVEDLVDAYKLVRNPQLEVRNFELIGKAFPGLARKHDPLKECGEGRTEGIRLLLRERDAEELLADADDFPAGTTIKTFFTTNVLVKYTLDAGNVNALTGAFATLPAADSNFDFPDGVAIGVIRANLADLHPSNTEVAPTYVQKVGLLAEFALTRYINAPASFIDPRNGATRLEYRVLKQAPGIAGQTNASWSHVEVDIDNTDAQNFGTVPHEMFHQVQYRYNGTTTRSGIYGILREGGARLAEDCIFDRPNRYASSAANDLFPSPQETMLDLGGSSTPIRYAAGLFWKYLAEHHSNLTSAADEPAIGVDTYRILLEETATATADYTVQGLRNARGKMPWYGSFDQFFYYDAAKTELDSHETTWGNYLLANILHDLILPGDADFDERFNYLEDEDTLANVTLNTLRANIQVADSITIGQGQSFVRNRNGHKPYAAFYYEVLPNAASVPRMVRIDFSATNGMTDPLIQIVRLGTGGSIVDVHRSDKATYSKTINMQGLSRLIIIAASRENGGDFSLTFTEVASNTDVMVTRWNSSVGTEYEVNPKGWAWTWVSPDIMVDNNDDLLEDTEVFFGVNNKLKVRLRNRGNADAAGIQIRFWYQKATPYLTTAGWMPVQNLANVTQEITGASLIAGAENWFAVDWAPDNDGTDHKHWCVKVEVTVAGDPNVDNKIAFRNFSNVIPDPDGDFIDFSILLRNLKFRIFDDVQIIPRGTQFNLDLTNRVEIVKPLKPHLSFCDCRNETVLDSPDDLAFGRFKVASAANLKRWDKRTTAKANDSDFYYPVDKRILPPGANAENLVTVTHEVNGRVIGGVTYRIDTEKR